MDERTNRKGKRKEEMTLGSWREGRKGRIDGRTDQTWYKKYGIMGKNCRKGMSEEKTNRKKK